MIFGARAARGFKRMVHRMLRMSSLDIERTGEGGGLHVVRVPRFGVEQWDDVRAILRGDPVCVFDVGGHVGETAVRLSDEYPRARIFSFEPDPDSFPRLVQATRGCAGVEALPAALGDREGDATLYRNRESATNSLLKPLEATDRYVVQPGSLDRRGESSVRLTTIDRFSADRSIERIDLLKIDAQGYEIRILDGAAGLIDGKKIPLVYLEVNFVSLYLGQPLFVEVYEYLRTRGYRLVGLYETGYRTHFYLVSCNALFVAEELGSDRGMKILYAFTKNGFEADFWSREISAASGPATTFIPFNYSAYLSPRRYIRAQLLDNLYYERDAGLFALYEDFERTVRETQADVVLVDTCPPFHPDYLRGIPLYKALRIADGPISAYDRDFAYLHAYDHVLYHSPAYSRDLSMKEKLAYCGARRADLWPLALFDAQFEPGKREAELMGAERDIDILFIGAIHVGKMPLLAQVKRAFGKRCRMYGLSSWKKNVYFNARHGMPGWIRPVPPEDFVALYRRAKIGFNVHNRGKYTVGNYRMFELAGNGVLQISDGGEYLNEWFRVGDEIVGYETAGELIDRLNDYLDRPEERLRIASAGYRRVLRDHRIGDRLRQLTDLISAGMSGAEQRWG